MHTKLSKSVNGGSDEQNITGLPFDWLLENPSTFLSYDSALRKKTGVTEETGQEVAPSVEEETVDFNEAAPEEDLNQWNTGRVLWAWLLICFSTGPTASMCKTYVPAVIQSKTHALGHQKGTGEICTGRGDNCYIKFGAGEIQYTAYVLYLKALYTSMEGLVAIFVMGVADYNNNRKWLLGSAVVTFGVMAIPFVGLNSKTNASLITTSVLYCLMLIMETVYQITEGSYIPIFMSAASKDASSNTIDDNNEVGKSSTFTLTKGAKVSALGIMTGNLGGIMALLVGIIITYTKGTASEVGDHTYLLAVTIAGCTTVVIALAAVPHLPRVDNGVHIESAGQTFISRLKLPFSKISHILTDIFQYKEALKYLVAWVLWNIAYTNFLSVNGLMFRSTLGVDASAAEYTAWQFTSYVLALAGSLIWMLIFNWRCAKISHRQQIKTIKISLYVLLFFGWFSNVWGAFGINSDCSIGFKQRWEFWTFQVFFVSTSSALRSLHRVVYSSMLPEGKENQYFGLEIMLGLATGWSEALLVAIISDKTGNSRVPYLPNSILYIAAASLFWWCNIERGMFEVDKL